MKRRILALVVAALAFTFVHAQEKSTLHLSGTTAGVSTGKVYLHKFIDKYYTVVDSARIQNGAFSFSTKAVLPEIYGISLGTKDSPYMLFLDKNQITVKLDSVNQYRNTQIKGSIPHALFVEYKKQDDVKIDEFIKQHPSSIVAAYALYRDYSYRLTPAQIQSNIKLLSPALQNSNYVKVLYNLIKIWDKVAVGKQAPEFSGKTPDGTTVSLSNRLGKGYLLVDFWASWCPGCRQENPGIVKVFQKYKDKGFDILAISLDKSKDKWVKAIADDHLDWTQISELKFWQSDPVTKYGIRVIPSNVLVDSKGTIVARNLFGEDLDHLLNKLLSK